MEAREKEEENHFLGGGGFDSVFATGTISVKILASLKEGSF